MSDTRAAILVIALTIGAATVEHPEIALPCLIIAALAVVLPTWGNMPGRKRKQG